ncbi:TNF receptor-associated factor homolog 1a [Tanacetum coccineum]
MAGTSSEESGLERSFDGLSIGQQRYREALAKCRSTEQVENAITPTSSPYWDTDDEDDSVSDLYGNYTWPINKFSKIDDRELRSNVFKVGGYSWYILIYPQGCDVCNHLSLFLCVDRDKLLPGWSQYAQFTVAVVNIDPKKSKYSGYTLHRFWKKEHDWGWKKFMKRPNLLDGFLGGDTLVIKAQVQVIRERADRPFRCLDHGYRREFIRVYFSNVEQICHHFVEEKRGRFMKLIEDRVRWSSFSNFWLGIDQKSRRRMSREKSDIILKVLVKQFFIGKEVTSCLVIDTLNSGLKALEGQRQTQPNKVKGNSNAEEVPMSVFRMENGTYVLVNDVLLLLERVALEPLPPKDEIGPQKCTKDGGSGEDFSKVSIEHYERRLTELGRRTIEMLVLSHIFSKIEGAYQEAVALRRQEELIREEEGMSYQTSLKSATAIPTVDMTNNGWKTVVNKRKSGKTCSTNTNRSGVNVCKIAWQSVKPKVIFEPKAHGNSPNATAKKECLKAHANSSNIPTFDPYDLLSQKLDPDNYTRSGVIRIRFTMIWRVRRTLELSFMKLLI